MTNLIILSLNSFLTQKLLTYLHQIQHSFKIYIFTTSKNNLDKDLNIFPYSEIEKVTNNLGEGFIINFAGYNIFKAFLFPQPLRDYLIWNTRIRFTQTLSSIVKKKFVFIIPSAVWIYSQYLRKEFERWENTVKNRDHIIFRLGIVLNQDSLWTKIFHRILKLGIKPVFPDNFLFPYISVKKFMEVLIHKINHYKQSEVINLFYITSFNLFVNFLIEKMFKQNIYREYVQLNPFITKSLIYLIFGKYGKVFDSMDFSELDENNPKLKMHEDIEQCFT
ncbi:MAG: hypothetical protein ABDH21_02250 [bacterium]